MFIQFLYNEGNPYIVKTNAELWRMLNKYETEIIGAFDLKVIGYRVPARTYREKQSLLREIAIEAQQGFTKYAELGFYGWGDVVTFESFFYEYGKKYGLLTEFHENAIC